MLSNPILQKAIAHYGAENQTIKAIEEMAELTKELCKAMIGQADNDHIREEIADVEIMVEQLKKIYGNTKVVKQAKLDRLADRLVKLESKQ